MAAGTKRRRSPWRPLKDAPLAIVRDLSSYKQRPVNFILVTELRIKPP